MLLDRGKVSPAYIFAAFIPALIVAQGFTSLIIVLLRRCAIEGIQSQETFCISLWHTFTRIYGISLHIIQFFIIIIMDPLWLQTWRKVCEHVGTWLVITVSMSGVIVVCEFAH